jgi:hypothetical protein
VPRGIPETYPTLTYFELEDPESVDVAFCDRTTVWAVRFTLLLVEFVSKLFGFAVTAQRDDIPPELPLHPMRILSFSRSRFDTVWLMGQAAGAGPGAILVSQKCTRRYESRASWKRDAVSALSKLYFRLRLSPRKTP